MKSFLLVGLMAVITFAVEDECGTEQPPEPMAFYPLNGQYGTSEISNKAEDGVATGVSLAPGPDGTVDGSFQFDGNVNSYIEFPNNGKLETQNSMTLLCWVYPEGQDGPLFNYRPSGSWGVHLWIVNTNELFVRFTKRDYSFTDGIVSTPLSLSQWWFLGASYDSTTGDAKLWVDGQVSQTLNIGQGLALATQDDVRMGVKADDGRYFRGRIARMGIYNFALTEEEVQAVKEEVQVAACHGALGMENYYVPDAQISASSEWNDVHAAVQGRLHFQAGGGKMGAWSASTNDQNQWLQVDFGTETTINMVATQGRNAVGQWVTSYKVDYSTDGTSFQYYNENGDTTGTVFTGNSDQDTVVYHKFSPAIKGRKVRVRPQSWHSHVSMRVEFYGCSACMAPLGMESGAIADGQISASSEWNDVHAAVQGRLHFKVGGGKMGAWSASTNDQSQWLQADLGSVKDVTRFASQGRNAVEQWVTSYKLQSSTDENTYQYYRKEGDSADTILDGNSDSDTVVYHVLIPAINGRFIRVRPMSWHNHISMRMELYGC